MSEIQNKSVYGGPWGSARPEHHDSHREYSYVDHSHAFRPVSTRAVLDGDLVDLVDLFVFGARLRPRAQKRLDLLRRQRDLLRADRRRSPLVAAPCLHTKLRGMFTP